MGEHKALDVYLNDHLAGATAACNSSSATRPITRVRLSVNSWQSLPPRSTGIAKRSKI